MHKYIFLSKQCVVHVPKFKNLLSEASFGSKSSYETVCYALGTLFSLNLVKPDRVQRHIYLFCYVVFVCNLENSSRKQDFQVFILRVVIKLFVMRWEHYSALFS